jgi:hypothetical protein
MARVNGSSSRVAAVVAAGMVVVAISVAVAGQEGASGFVVDASTGAPVIGATLRVTERGTPVVLASATARQDGGFSLATKPDGILEVGAPGYATKRVLWPSADLGSPLTIALERAARLVIHREFPASMRAPRRTQVLAPGDRRLKR